MLRRADEKDRKELLALWQEGFGDSVQDIEQFFEFNMDTADVFVEDDGGISAALYGLPCTIECEGRSLSARYIYAVATSLERRSQGIMSRLIPFAHRQMEDDGVEVFWLYPADSGLMKYYEKFGYRPILSAKKAVVVAEKVDLPIEELTPEDAAELRRQLLSRKDAVNWSGSALAYAAEFYEARWYRVGDALALVHSGDGTLEVPEMLSFDPTLTAQALCTRLGAAQAEVTLPYWCIGEDKPMPMVRMPQGCPNALYAGLELNG